VPGGEATADDALPACGRELALAAGVSAGPPDEPLELPASQPPKASPAARTQTAAAVELPNRMDPPGSIG
jgi:hypothetical protein